MEWRTAGRDFLVLREECERRFAGEESSGRALQKPGEAEPVPGQTCPIETAPGELQDIEVKETRPWRPGPEPLRFRDIRRWDQSRALRRQRSRQAATPATGLCSLVLARTTSGAVSSRPKHMTIALTVLRWSASFGRVTLLASAGSPQPDAHDIPRPDGIRKDRRLP